MTCAFSRISFSLGFVLSGAAEDSTLLDALIEEEAVVACAEEIEEEIEERVSEAEDAEEELIHVSGRFK